MNRCHDYDDELTADAPPPWWRGLLALILLIAAVVGLAVFCASCTCTLDGESIARAIIIYQSGK